MDLLRTIGSDGAILLFSAAGLLATTLAILSDTRTQRAEIARGSIRLK